ncbi:hypothetical protein Btru_046481 [Bulinus truncatus]|nr:hypothetical protein Btru_046481 [Bulinus truncatus]
MLLFGGILVFGSSMFTLHYMLWCDSMQQIYNQSCSVSAQFLPPAIDTPMFTYKHRLELQQIVMWSMYPVSLVLVLAYVLALRLSTVSPDTPASDQSGSYRYVLMREETAPLLPPTYQPTYNSNIMGQNNSGTSDYWSSRTPSIYPNVPTNRPATPAIPCSTSPIIPQTDDIDSVSRVRSQTENSNINPFA